MIGNVRVSPIMVKGRSIAQIAPSHDRRFYYKAPWTYDLSLRLPRDHAAHRSAQPRPTNGILVAITVRNKTFASRGRLAMYTTARATLATSIVGSTAFSPLA